MLILNEVNAHRLMIYKKYQVDEKYSKFVECLFTWEGNVKDEKTIETPPNAFTSIVFNIGSPYRYSNHKYDKKTLPKTFVAGQSIRNYFLHISGKICMVGIVFKPTGLYHYLKIPMYGLTGERIPLLDIFPEETPIIENEIIKASSTSERLKVLLSFLESLHQHGAFATEQITLASNKILDLNGDISVNDLLENVFMSRRQFERKFLNEVGVSPKMYAKIRRFGYTCRFLAGKRKVNLTEVLYKGGYYDQSHFIKDFKYFAGRTPKFYVENNKELAHFINKHELV